MKKTPLWPVLHCSYGRLENGAQNPTPTGRRVFFFCLPFSTRIPVSRKRVARDADGISYRFFQDVHSKHVHIASNMSPRVCRVRKTVVRRLSHFLCAGLTSVPGDPADEIFQVGFSRTQTQAQKKKHTLTHEHARENEHLRNRTRALTHAQNGVFAHT